MPAKLTWGPGHYTIEYSGIVTIDDTLRIYGEIVGSQNFDNSKYAILDCRNIACVDYSKLDYKKHAAIAMSAAKIKENLRVALVVPNEGIESLVRPFLESVTEKFQHKWERRIFREYDDAVAWGSATPNQTPGG